MGFHVKHLNRLTQSGRLGFAGHGRALRCRLLCAVSAASARALVAQVAAVVVVAVAVVQAEVAHDCR